MSVEDTKENLAICMEYCGTCPSLPFPPQPYLFCARGASSENIEKKDVNVHNARYTKKTILVVCIFVRAAKHHENSVLVFS